MAKPVSLYTIAPAYGFTDYLAKGLIEWSNAQKDPLFLAKTHIFLPSIRSVEALRYSFMQYAPNNACLLPNMHHLGDYSLEETTTDTNDALQILSTEKRQYILYKLIKAHGIFEQYDIHQQWNLAYSLGYLLDQTVIYNVDLSQASTMLDSRLSHYWQQMIPYITLIVEEWQHICQEQQLIDKELKQQQHVTQLCAYLQKEQPNDTYIVAGSTGSRPLSRMLMQHVSNLPNGLVVFPGLDIHMTQDEYDYLLQTGHHHYPHPQKILCQTIKKLGATLSDVQNWPYQGAETKQNKNKNYFIRTLMCPPPLSDKWHDIDADNKKIINNMMRNITIIEARDELMEAHMISLIIRKYYDENKKIALITGDRFLAQNVIQYLKYYGLIVHDTAGQKLTLTQEGQLCMSFLHFYWQQNTISLRHFLQELQQYAPAFHSDFANITALIQQIDHYNNTKFYNDIEALLQSLKSPLTQLLYDITHHSKKAPTKTFKEHLALLLRFFEHYTNNDNIPLANHTPILKNIIEYIYQLQEVLQEDTQHITNHDFTLWFNELLHNKNYVTPIISGHNIHIWGYLEARLQQADILIYGAFNEQIMPRTPKVDYFLPKKLKQQLGFLSDEDIISLQAHDLSVALSGERVFLTRSEKENGEKTTKSRWLERLIALADITQTNVTDAAEEWLYYYNIVHAKHHLPSFEKPTTTVPNNHKVKKMGITSVEKLLLYPFDFYAEKILKLKPNQEYNKKLDNRLLGIIAHDFAEQVTKFLYKNHYLHDDNITTIMQQLWQQHFQHQPPAELVQYYFDQRLHYLAYALKKQYLANPPKILYHECTASYTHPQNITITAQADRIDIYDNACHIIDYKTGAATVASNPLQLPIEAYMLANGYFQGITGVNDDALHDISCYFYKIAFNRLDIKNYKLHTSKQDILQQKCDELDHLLTQYNNDAFDFLHKTAISPYSQHKHLLRMAEWGEELMIIEDILDE